MVKVEEDHNMAGLCEVFKGSRWINEKPWDDLMVWAMG